MIKPSENLEYADVRKCGDMYGCGQKCQVIYQEDMREKGTAHRRQGWVRWV